MTFQLSIDTEEDQFSLKIKNFRPESGDLIYVRLEEVRELLEAIVSSDEAASSLTAAELSQLQPSLAALELKYKILIHQAAQLASTARLAAEGRGSSFEHALPELDDV